MARQTIKIGTVPNDKTGDPLRTGGDKINDNFIELYNALEDVSTYVGADDDTIGTDDTGKLECLIFGRSTTSTLSARFWTSEYTTTTTSIGEEPMQLGEYCLGLGKYALTTGDNNIILNGGNPNTLDLYTGNQCLIIGSDIIGSDSSIQGVVGTGDNAILIGNNINNIGNCNIIVQTPTSEALNITGSNNYINANCDEEDLELTISNSLIIDELLGGCRAGVKNVISRGTNNYIENVGELSAAINYNTATEEGHKISDLILGSETDDDGSTVLSLNGYPTSDYVDLSEFPSGNQVIAYKLTTSIINGESTDYYWEEGSGVIIKDGVNGNSVADYTIIASGGAIPANIVPSIAVDGDNFIITTSVTAGSGKYLYTARLQLTQVRLT